MDSASEGDGETRLDDATLALGRGFRGRAAFPSVFGLVFASVLWSSVIRIGPVIPVAMMSPV